MASPVVQTTSENSVATAGTSHAITLPSGITAADLVLIILDKGTPATTATFNALTDWTEILDENTASGLFIAYYTGAGVPSDPTFTSSASIRSASIAYRISGADKNVTPQIGTTATGTSLTPDPPASATPPSSKDYLFIAFAGMTGEEADDDTWGNTPPTNYLPNPPLQKSCGTAGASLGGLILAASRQLTTGSAENPGTFNVDVSAAWRAQTITVHPAPAATATSVARVSLASGGTPATATLHSITVRARKQSGLGVVTLTAALYEGATNRSGNLTTSDLTTSLADYTLFIPDASAANITDYSDLEIRFNANSSTGDAVIVEVADIYLSTPASSGSALTQAVNDALAITDSPVSEHGWGQLVADPIAITDARTFVVTYDRTIADPIALTDARAFDVGSSLADAIALTDTQTPASGLFPATLADSIALTDAQSFVQGFASTIADSLGITDALAEKAVGLAIADALGITDARAFGLGPSLADALGIADVVTPAEGFFPATLADALSLTDAESFAAGFVNALADALGLTDARTFASDFFPAALADALGITDVNAAVEAFNSALDDALGISDNATTDFTGGDTTPPVTLFISDTRQKLSLVSGFDSTDVTWSADEDCQSWEIRQVSSSSDVHTDGTLLVSGGAITADEEQVTSVPASALTGGDGEKVIKLFARDLAGNWTT